MNIVLVTALIGHFPLMNVAYHRVAPLMLGSIRPASSPDAHTTLEIHGAPALLAALLAAPGLPSSMTRPDLANSKSPPVGLQKMNVVFLCVLYDFTI